MVLTGDGGDEALSGYPAYQSERFVSGYQQLSGGVRHALELGLSGLSKLISGGAKYKLHRIVNVLRSSSGSFQERLLAKLAWIDLDMLEGVLEDRGVVRPIEDYLDEVFSACQFDDPFYRLMYFHYHVSLPERMLTKVDRVSMASSLECRAPFLDPRLVELLAAVSKDVKMPKFERKYLLRTTVGKSLPKEIMRAPKKGFIPPLRCWLNESNTREYVQGGLLEKIGLSRSALSELIRMNSSGEKDTGNFLWMVILLLRWVETDEVC